MKILILLSILIILLPTVNAQTLDKFNLEEKEQFGYTISSIGDLNGDGVNDIAVGAPYDNQNGEPIGAIYILFLNSDGTVKSSQEISSTEGNFYGDIEPHDAFGRSISNIGDFDGDGVNDIAVGAYHDDDGGYNTGAVYILFLNSDGTVKSHQKISSTEGNFHEDIESGDCWGNAVTGMGDLNGDGVNDIAVGAHSNYSPDRPDTRIGAVHVLFLNSDGTVKSSQEISNTHGNLQTTIEEGDRFGISVSKIEDLNGDGVNDIAVGAMGDDDGGSTHGAVYILFLNSDGTVKSEQKISSTEGNFSGELDEGDLFGYGVNLIGDLNGDGVNDIAVGAYGDDDSKLYVPPSLGGEASSSKGAVYILFLNSDGTVKSEQKISEKYGDFNRQLSDILQQNDVFGFSVSKIEDLNGDGVNDIAVGAPYTDTNEELQDTGAIHILFLNSDGTVKSNNIFPKIQQQTDDFVLIMMMIILSASIGLIIYIKTRKK